jgi:hypothetical protein
MKKFKKLLIFGCLFALLVSSIVFGLALTSHLYVRDGKLILTLVTEPAILFFDDFNGDALSSPWLVEDTGSTITAYFPFIPSQDSFTVSAKVSSSQLAAFGLRIQCGNTPIFGSTSGIMLEMDPGVEGKWFVASWTSASGWTWNNFYGPVNINTWYIIEMVVQKSPFKVTFNVYNSDGSLLGTYQTTNLGVAYSSIKYVCLELWTGPATYSIDWVKIIY